MENLGLVLVNNSFSFINSLFTSLFVSYFLSIDILFIKTLLLLWLFFSFDFSQVIYSFKLKFSSCFLLAFNFKDRISIYRFSFYIFMSSILDQILVSSSLRQKHYSLKKVNSVTNSMQYQSLLTYMSIFRQASWAKMRSLPIFSMTFINDFRKCSSCLKWYYLFNQSSIRIFQCMVPYKLLIQF